MVAALLLVAGPAQRAASIFQFPTHTDDTLGVAKWAAGPSAVVLRVQGPWVYGVLVDNR